MKQRKLRDLQPYHQKPPTKKAREIIAMLVEMKGKKGKKDDVPLADDRLVNVALYQN